LRYGDGNVYGLSGTPELIVLIGVVRREAARATGAHAQGTITLMMSGHVYGDGSHYGDGSTFGGEAAQIPIQ
jgi:hypothetical protein